MHIYSLIFVHFSKFPVLDFGLDHSGSLAALQFMARVGLVFLLHSPAVFVTLRARVTVVVLGYGDMI